MQNIFANNHTRSKPGLLITATDTGVGKTVVTCAIAWALMQHDRNLKLGVCKPFASGCELKRGQLFNDDAIALSHFAQCRQPMAIINPVKFRQPLAPAVASEIERTPVDFNAIENAINTLDQQSDVVLVEAVGGLYVPLDPKDPNFTVADLAKQLDYPVLIVARANLGTLNHTAMTAACLKAAGCKIAGVVINGFTNDPDDPSNNTNPQWITKMTGLPILATIAQQDPAHVIPHEGRIPQAILHEVAQTHWPDLLAPPSLT